MLQESDRGSNRPNAPEIRRAQSQTSPEKAANDRTVPDIMGGLANWNPTSTDLNKLEELTRRSLESVTHLTEYEDDKANRILTAIAFVSALAGLLFALVPDRYPPKYVFGLLCNQTTSGFILAAIYVLFGIYAVALLIGVLFVLVAVKPRFNVPQAWKIGSPRSFLFYQKILETSPENWGKAFKDRSVDELRLEYAKNSIVETYLIAEKIPKKLRPLNVGVRLFIFSTLVLVFAVVLLFLAMCTIPFKP